jgi:hypothetical protein
MLVRVDVLQLIITYHVSTDFSDPFEILIVMMFRLLDQCHPASTALVSGVSHGGKILIVRYYSFNQYTS